MLGVLHPPCEELLFFGVFTPRYSEERSFEFDVVLIIGLLTCLNSITLLQGVGVNSKLLILKANHGLTHPHFRCKTPSDFTPWLEWNCNGESMDQASISKTGTQAGLSLISRGQMSAFGKADIWTTIVNSLTNQKPANP